MSDVAERDFLSIGEVLELLKDDHPDITISKIRFLESQGLLAPERTPSGYRKFYDDDIVRLRWILHQQKEHFLPLKVIKDRLDDDPEAVQSLASAAQNGSAGGEGPAQAALTPDGGAPAPTAGVPADGGPDAGQPQPPPPPAPAVAPGEAPSTRRRRAAAAEGDQAGPAAGAVDRETLAGETGLTVSQLAELVRYGMVEEKRASGSVYYDAESAEVARLAAAFMRHGVEARHLRMYRTAAEREGAFLEQLVMPLLKQRNPDARQRAVGTIRELSDLGARLRGVLVQRELREHLRR